MPGSDADAASAPAPAPASGQASAQQSTSPSAHPSAQASREPSVFAALRDLPQQETRLKQEHHIRLQDHTRSAFSPEPPSSDWRRAEDDRDRDSDSEAPSDLGASRPLYKRLTHSSTGIQQSVNRQVKKQISRRKYGRYSRDRYADPDDDDATLTATTSNSLPPPDEDPGAPQFGQVASPTQVGTLEAIKGKKNAYASSSLPWRRKKKQLREETRDQVVDVLYENQRGAFLFGIPKYSASSLLPWDPRPWQNGEFRTSPVDIRHAQVPDPSWEWVWKQWYVDMSRDVDEEGWEYTFVFPGPLGQYGWHGNHPWFHSFVRRRRWLRLRRRKSNVHKTKERGHALTAEYFTIHPKTLRAPTEYGKAMSRSTSFVRMQALAKNESSMEEMEILSIADLLAALRKSAVDREKLAAVRKFVAHGGEELYYLRDRMEEIMHLLVFQSSRRRLLAELLALHDSAHKSREDLEQHTHEHDDPQMQIQHEAAQRHTDNIHNAVLEAERLVKRLEYWSDVKGMAEKDPYVDVLDPAGEHPKLPFRNKQRASDGLHPLHKHPEHHDDEEDDDNEDGDHTHDHETTDGGKKVVKKESSKWFDAPTSPPSAFDLNRAGSTGLLRTTDSHSLAGRLSSSFGDDRDSLDRYTTAQESASESGGSAEPSPRKSSSSMSKSGGGGALSPAQKGRVKVGRLKNLDGMMDEAAEEADEEAREAYWREMRYPGKRVGVPGEGDGGEVVGSGGVRAAGGGGEDAGGGGEARE